MDSLKLYDLGKLEAMNDESFTNKMVDLFMNEMSLEFNKIEKALEEKDYNTITSVAHKIKPSIDYVCISSLYEEVKIIESWEQQDVIMIEKTAKFIVSLKAVLQQLKGVR